MYLKGNIIFAIYKLSFGFFVDTAYDIHTNGTVEFICDIITVRIPIAYGAIIYAIAIITLKLSFWMTLAFKRSNDTDIKNTYY